MKKIFIWLTVGGFLIVLASPASALTLSPPSIEVNGDPGQSVPIKVKLYNETDKEVTVHHSFLDFGAKEGEDGEPEFFENTQNDLKQLSSWIKTNNDTVELKPGLSVEVPFTIDIPQDAEPGGHFATIFFGPRKIAAESKGVGINYQTGSLVLLNVSGPTTEKGQVQSFLTKDKTSLFTMLPITFEARVDNKGNVHFKPTGTVEVKNMFGQRSAMLDVIKTQSGGNVLPHSTRRFDVLWTDGLDQVEATSFFAKAAQQWKHFHFGRYTATLSVALPKGEMGTGQVSFWVVPIQLLILMIITLVILIFLLRFYNGWITKRAVNSKS